MSRQESRSVRFGLALSGGGLRAALFHIGVLTRLAELRLLPQVQVVSTVSGGSIVGALYYLHVKRLLETRRDEDIKPDDYVELVARLEAEFSTAVDANLRMQAFASGRSNWRMLWNHRYSLSDRMADLYNQYLYAPLGPVGPHGWVELPRLHIQPKGVAGEFRPLEPVEGGGTANDQRRNKVPILVINATTLNTGHLFQFTASRMGEPAAGDAYDTDGNQSLGYARYGDLPEKYQRLPLGVAVAASAAVPGIFPPMALTDLYPGRADGLTPQLVDGGVHDNQGVAALFDPEYACTHVVVSDASGQLDDVAAPSRGLSAVIQRSNAILMDRVREEALRATALRQADDPARVAILHLKDGLRPAQPTPVAAAPTADASKTSLRPVAIDRRVQECLARVRTDLDAFTETERDALMACGYEIASRRILPQLPAAVAGGTAPLQPPPPAFVARLDGLMENPSDTFLAHLEVAARRVGKTIRLVPWLAWLAGPVPRALLIVALLAGAGAAVIELGWKGVVGVVGTGLTGLLVFATLVCLQASAQRRGWRVVEWPLRWGLAFLPGLPAAFGVGFLVRRYLEILAPLRLDVGAVDTHVPPVPPVGDELLQTR